MKRMGIFVLLSLLIPFPAVAIPLQANFTGVTAQLFDSPGYIEAGHGAGNQGTFGGPSARNILGHAYQFSLDTMAFVKGAMIDFTVDGYSYPSGITPAANFSVMLYAKTVHHSYWGSIPDTRAVIFRSGMFHLAGAGEHRDFFAGGINTLLNPGIYWLGIEGSGAITNFSNVRPTGNYGSVPEPASFLLFGLGLPLLWRKRKISR